MKNLALKLFTALLFLVSVSSNGQELKLSKEMKDAIENGTRTLNGVPGEKYWINSSDYSLDVNVVFEGDTTWIKGSGRITYHNNSPDQLNMIVIRSYPDLNAPAAIRDFYFGGAAETAMVEYSDVFVNGDTVQTQMMYRRRTSTNIVMALREPVEPGGEAVIDIKWKYMMHPQINIRQGVYEGKSLFVAYWYPQVAVYDDMYGWDMVDYTGLVEFYNDFNNYDIRITLPGDYFVWAGGTLQNQPEVYPSNIIKAIETAMISDEVVNILPAGSTANTGTGNLKTWHFKSEHIPDFTFAASKSHLWDAASIDVGNGKRVLVSAVYPTSSKFFSNAAIWARETIDYLSFTCPGVPYPWPYMTVFNNMEGGSAMESPMMVNSGDQQSEGWAREVTFHEIAHSIMPFYLGANERKYAWMDEGWATYQGIKWSDASPGTGVDMFNGVFSQVTGTSNDLPLMIPSWQLKDQNGETFHAYVRSSQAYFTIENQLGTEKMNQAWKLFARRWYGKHPSPWDLFATFTEVAGEDLTWLLYPWYYKFAYSDLAIVSVDLTKGEATVENIGGLPMPVYLSVNYSDGTSEELYRKPDAFKSSARCIIRLDKPGMIESIELGNKYFMDGDSSNNSWSK